MTTNFANHTLTYGASTPRWAGAPARKRGKANSGFLLFVTLAVALGVVALIEPSPGDICITLLIVQGFFCGNLRWEGTGALPFMLLGLFILSNLASLCYAIDLRQGMTFFLVTLFMIATWVFTVGILNRFQERGLLVLMSGYTIGGVLSSLCAVLAYFGLLPFGDIFLFFDRIKGLFKDPNVFGPYLVIVAVYSIYRLQASKGALRLKAWWLFSCLISTVGVLLCFSRGAWANYLVTLFVFFVLHSITNRAARTLCRNLAYFMIALVLIGGAVAYVLTLPQVSEVFAYRTQRQAYDDARLTNQSAALELGLDNPLGVGPGQSFLLLNYATHSLYLRVLSENGVVGFLSFAAFLLLTLVRSLLLSQQAPHPFQRAMFTLIAAAMLGTLLNSMAIDTLHWRHFWFLLALGWMPLWAAPPNLHSATRGRESAVLTALPVSSCAPHSSSLDGRSIV